MLFTADGIKIQPTTHFEQRAVQRGVNRQAVLALISHLAPRLMPYQGRKLALDCGLNMMPVVIPRVDCIEVLTVLRPNQQVRSDTLRVNVSLKGASNGDRLFA